MELLIITWVLFGIAAVLVANNKGMDGCSWFVIGFLLGPFGLLFALLSSGRQCPHCKKGIHADATKCPYCQSDLTRDSSTRKSSLANSGVDHSLTPGTMQRECRHCGQLTPVTKTECHHCGRSFIVT